MNQSEKKSRLTREAWLQKALDVLAEDPEHLRIDELAERLGVSKGSFYWHFDNRSDFIHAMAEFWRDVYTAAIADQVSEYGGSAEERLRAIMRQILDNKVAQYDLAVRAWSRHEPSIRPVIREVDEIRTKTVRGFFLEMGFDEEEANMRSRLFILCHSLEDAFSIPLSQKEAHKQIDTRLAFFTRR